MNKIELLVTIHERLRNNGYNYVIDNDSRNHDLNIDVYMLELYHGGTKYSDGICLIHDDGVINIGLHYDVSPSADESLIELFKDMVGGDYMVDEYHSEYMHGRSGIILTGYARSASVLHDNMMAIAIYKEALNRSVIQCKCKQAVRCNDISDKRFIEYLANNEEYDKIESIILSLSNSIIISVNSASYIDEVRDYLISKLPDDRQVIYLL